AGSGGAAEALVAEHLQPVLVLLATQQLRRALPLSLLALAPHETPVVEEEPQQLQVVRPQLPPQEEVAPQPAIQVFRQATGAGHPAAHPPPRLAQPVIACPQLPLLLGLTLPPPAVPFRHLLCL